MGGSQCKTSHGGSWNREEQILVHQVPSKCNKSTSRGMMEEEDHEEDEEERQ